MEEDINHTFLKKIGLTGSEIKVYLALLKFGDSQKGKLIKASYFSEPVFTNPEDYIINFLKIKKAMTEKYGTPISDSSWEINNITKEMYRQVGEVIERGGQFYDVRWETSRTKIKMVLSKKFNSASCQRRFKWPGLC